MIDYTYEDLNTDLAAHAGYNSETSAKAARRIKNVFTKLLRSSTETDIERELSLELAREVARLRIDLEIAEAAVLHARMSFDIIRVDES